MRIPADAAVVIGAAAALPAAAALVLGGAALRKAARRLGLARRPAPAVFERPWAVWTALGIWGLYGAALLYAWQIEPAWVELTTIRIPVSRPVLGQERFRIVHLSDLHLRGMGRRERRVIELVREAKPDLILLTGDYGRSPAGQAALALLGRALEAPLGLYGVRGNDDYGGVPSRRTLQAAGIVLLHNEGRILERDGRRLCLAGIDYGSKVPLRSVLRGEREDDVAIFLHHMPEAVDELGRLDPTEHVDLFLCGHTHGGQVCVPFWGAVVTESRYHKTYESGLYQAHGVPMYVSRGIGLSVLPFRFLARPEVAVIDLVHPGGPP